jgi:hypothetical protein
MMDNQAQFYRRRLAEECDALIEAATPEARELHRALAEGYADKLRELGETGHILTEADPISPT